MARVVVVGAGMGGLAVAARLATLGHDVEVIEASDTWGGKLGTWSRQGFTFDTGAVPADSARCLPRALRLDRRAAR